MDIEILPSSSAIKLHSVLWSRALMLTKQTDFLMCPHTDFSCNTRNRSWLQRGPSQPATVKTYVCFLDNVFVLATVVGEFPTLSIVYTTFTGSIQHNTHPWTPPSVKSIYDM